VIVHDYFGLSVCLLFLLVQPARVSLAVHLYSLALRFFPFPVGLSGRSFGGGLLISLHLSGDVLACFLLFGSLAPAFLSPYSDIKTGILPN